MEPLIADPQHRVARGAMRILLFEVVALAEIYQGVLRDDINVLGEVEAAELATIYWMTEVAELLNGFVNPGEGVCEDETRVALEAWHIRGRLMGMLAERMLDASTKDRIRGVGLIRKIVVEWVDQPFFVPGWSFGIEHCVRVGETVEGDAADN